VSLAETAAFLAQQWPVFACGADKRPVTEHGFKDASRDTDAVRTMFRRPGAALIGVPTGEASDLAVIDLDVKDGASGLEWLAANEHRLPATRRHRTRSGGLHLLFRYPAGRRVRNSASKIAPGVDVRGEGGYIIAPPSDGYAIADDAMPVAMPAWLVDLLDPPAPPPAARPSVSREWRDTSAAGSRYGLAALSDESDAICNAPFGRQEMTLNEAGLKIGALIAGGELEAGFARETLIRAGMAMASEPGKPAWVPEEIRKKVERAIADGSRSPRQAPERPQLIRRVTEEFAPPEPPPHDEPPAHWDYEPDISADMHRPAATDEPKAPSIFPTLSLDEIEGLPPPTWLIEGLLVEASNASLIAPPKSLKSFVALDWALHIAYGLPWQGRPVKQGGVLYIAGEGVGGMGRRIKAWRAFHGVEDRNAPFRLLAVPFRIMQADHVKKVIRTALAIAEADGMRIVLAVNDTLARSMAGADENSAQDMGVAVGGMDEIRTEVGCAILTVHHTGKDKDRGARGSSALLGAVDTEITVERQDATLTIQVTAQKDAEEGDAIVIKARKVGMDGGEPGEGAQTSLVLVELGAGEVPAQRPSGRLSGDQETALRILHDALASHGEPDHHGCPPGLRSIPDGWWRERFYERAKPGADQDTKQKAFRRASDALLKANVIGMNRGRVWVI